MFELKQCHQCNTTIELGDAFARFKNPEVGQINYLYFHQRGRGDCYWIYLRDKVINVHTRRADDPIQAT